MTDDNQTTKYGILTDPSEGMKLASSTKHEPMLQPNSMTQTRRRFLITPLESWRSPKICCTLSGHKNLKMCLLSWVVSQVHPLGPTIFLLDRVLTSWNVFCGDQSKIASRAEWELIAELSRYKQASPEFAVALLVAFHKLLFQPQAFSRIKPV